MKLPPLLTGYIFDPANSRIDFGNLAGFDIRHLSTIIHIPTGEPLFSQARTYLAPASVNGAVVTFSPQVETSAMSASDALLVIYDDGTLAATDARLEAVRSLVSTGNATLSSILSAVQASGLDFEETVWTDPATGLFYARRVAESGGTYTVTFTDPTGATVTPPSGIEPAARTPYRVIESTFLDATAAGTGFAKGDVLARVIVFDTRTNTIAASFWHNVTQGTTISAPAANAYVEQTKAVVATSPQLPTALGAQVAAQSLGVALATDGPVGTNADAAATSDAGSFSLIALVKRALANWTTLLGRIPSGGVASAAAQNALLLFTDVTKVVVPVNSTTAPAMHALPAAPCPYSWFNATFQADQAGNGIIQGSNDGFASQAVTVATVAVAGGATGVTGSVRATFGAYRAYYQNTNGVQGFATVTSSFSAA